MFVDADLRRRHAGAQHLARVDASVAERGAQRTCRIDAIIHADGTIGDVTLLRSTNEAFTRSAIDAVKQWKYTPIGFEAIVTVTVNFTLT